jgi:hypothetical protein
MQDILFLFFPTTTRIQNDFRQKTRDDEDVLRERGKKWRCRFLSSVSQSVSQSVCCTCAALLRIFHGRSPLDPLRAHLSSSHFQCVSSPVPRARLSLSLSLKCTPSSRARKPPFPCR